MPATELGKRSAWCIAAAMLADAVGAPSVLAVVLALLAAGLGTTAVLRP